MDSDCRLGKRSVVDIKSIVDGKVNAIGVDRSERYLIIQQDTNCLKKVQSEDLRIVAERSGLALRSGAEVTEKGEYWGAHSSKDSILIFTKQLNLRMVLPPINGQQMEADQAGVDFNQGSNVSRCLCQTRRFILFFRMSTMTLYMIQKATHKVTHRVNIGEILTERDIDHRDFGNHITLSFDEDTSYLLIKGWNISEKSIVVYSLRTKKIVLQPSGVPGMILTRGEATFTGGETTCAEFYFPDRTMVEGSVPYILVGGSRRSDDFKIQTPFLAICSFINGEFKVVDELKYPQNTFYFAYRIFVKRGSIYFVLGNLIITIKFEDGQLTEIDREQLVKTSGYSDISCRRGIIFAAETIIPRITRLELP